MKNNDDPARLFIKNRFKLSSNLEPKSAAILFGADEMPRNGDQFFPFRQNSDLFYLTGIQQEKTALILTPGHRDHKMQEILVILKPSPELEIWNGHKLSISEAKEISGIKHVIYEESVDSTLSDILSGVENIYLNKPELPKFLPDVASRDERLGKQIMEKFPYHNYKRLAPLLRDLRSVKEPMEADLISEAIKITHKGFQRVLSKIIPGMNEKEIEAILNYEFLLKGASGFAFPPIVASGKNACFLHYTDNNRLMEDGELLLMDFGAEYKNYAADISRTIPVNGKFSDRQAELYDGLLEIFYRAKEMMKPGVRMEEVHNHVCEMMKTFHTGVGLYSKEDLERAESEKSLWFKYYMHGTGHSLGLDVHDYYDKNAVFAPGMVFTCEPGIYIQDENTGIRLENDILITENGNEDLAKDIPIERKEIENLMKKR